MSWVLVLSLGWLLWEALGRVQSVLLGAPPGCFPACHCGKVRGSTWKNVGGVGGAVLRSRCVPREPPLCQRSAALHIQRRADNGGVPSATGKAGTRPALLPRGARGPEGRGTLLRRSSEQLTEMEEAWQLFVPGKPQDE